MTIKHVLHKWELGEIMEKIHILSLTFSLSTIRTNRTNGRTQQRHGAPFHSLLLTPLPPSLSLAHSLPNKKMKTIKLTFVSTFSVVIPTFITHNSFIIFCNHVQILVFSCFFYKNRILVTVFFLSACATSAAIELTATLAVIFAINSNAINGKNYVSSMRLSMWTCMLVWCVCLCDCVPECMCKLVWCEKKWNGAVAHVNVFAVKN